MNGPLLVFTQRVPTKGLDVADVRLLTKLRQIHELDPEEARYVEYFIDATLADIMARKRGASE